MSKFEVGARVATIDSEDLERHNHHEDTSIRGEVLEVNGDTYLVKWDGDWQKPNPQKMSEDDLLAEPELEEKLSELEKEYEAFAGPIGKKIKRAAKLLEEAYGLAEENGRELTDMDEVSPLITAMRHAGWRTSALWC